MTKIINFTDEEQAAAVNTLLLAFSVDPFQRYLMPNSSVFLKNSAIWFNNAASQSISINALLGTNDHSGVAIWFPPDYTVEFDAIEETLNDLPENSKKDIFRYFKEFEMSKPKDAWYLEYLGVDPRVHSQGIGSLLLEYSLTEIDVHHEPAYLESSNPRNMTLYERHGFQTLKKFQFGDGPPIHTMYREPR